MRSLEDVLNTLITEMESLRTHERAMEDATRENADPKLKSLIPLYTTELEIVTARINVLRWVAGRDEKLNYV